MKAEKSPDGNYGCGSNGKCWARRSLKDPRFAGSFDRDAIVSHKDNKFITCANGGLKECTDKMKDGNWIVYEDPYSDYDDY